MESVQQVVDQIDSQGNMVLDPITEYTGRAMTKTIKLPKTNLKNIHLHSIFSFIATFTGSPVAKKGGLLLNLIRKIRIKDAYGDLREVTVKDLRDYVSHYKGESSPMWLAQNDTELGDNATEAEFTFGTSGEPVTVGESLIIPFDMVLAEGNYQATLLNYNRGQSENTLEIEFNDLKDIIDGNEEVTFSGENFRTEINCKVTQDRGTRRWKQHPKEEQFTAPTNDRKFDLSGVKNFMNAKVEAYRLVDGKKVYLNLAECNKVKLDLEVMVNGTRTRIKEKCSLYTLMQEWYDQRDIAVRIPATAMFNVISANMLESALPNTFNELDILVSVGELDFSNPVFVRILIDELQ